jgi:hypothetical protein
MNWGTLRNLENSFKDFLDRKVEEDYVVGENNTPITIQVGRKTDSEWKLPCIVGYVESETLTRFEIGSNKRDKRELMIIDIYANNEGERLDWADWVTTSINDGFTYYTYYYNSENPDEILRTESGLVNIDFLTNTRVNLGQNISEIDAHRHRITVNVWISYLKEC